MNSSKSKENQLLVLAMMSLTVIMWAGIKPPLTLDIREEPVGGSHVMVGGPPARRYVGLLKNSGKSAALVLIMRMRGRSSGNGRFHACYLEHWSPVSHEWVYTPGPIAEINTSDVPTVLINGGSSVQVCDAVLSQEAGLCYRFVLQVQEKGAAAPSFLSHAFKIGALDTNIPGSCRN